MRSPNEGRSQASSAFITAPGGSARRLNLGNKREDGATQRRRPPHPTRPRTAGDSVSTTPVSRSRLGSHGRVRFTRNRGRVPAQAGPSLHLLRQTRLLSSQQPRALPARQRPGASEPPQASGPRRTCLPALTPACLLPGRLLGRSSSGPGPPCGDSGGGLFTCVSHRRPGGDDLSLGAAL